MIRLLLSGLLLSPALQPQPIPTPKPQVIEFQVGESEHEREIRAIQWKYENSWVDGSLTAYYNGKDKMNGETGVTASGYSLDNGIYYMGYRILAGDRSLPLGTLIDIKLRSGEVIHGVVLDRGGAIHGTHFDIVLQTFDECMEFGRQSIQWQKVGKINLDG